MKCPNCGGQMGLEDAFCPYCNTPNTMAVQHQSDMARYRQEYERTQENVLEKTSLLQSHGSWLIILAVLLVFLVAGIILHVMAWDIGYEIRTSNIERAAAEDDRVLDAYLEQGDYGKFVGYYNANDIYLDSNNPYQALRSAAGAYVDILQYISAMNNTSEYAFKPDRIADTCGYIASDLNRIFTLEQEYSYDLERYLPPDKRVYLEDIRERTTVIAETYFGLTNEQIENIPNVSVQRLGKLIEEGIAS